MRGVVLPHALFFLSGVAALAYEASWSRLVGLVLGNTADAAALVLAGYFAGLAAGQLIGGFLSGRIRPLLGYGVAELLAAGWAAIVPCLLSLGGMEGRLLEEVTPAARAAWCFLILLPTTAALGSTLPFMAAHFATGGVSGRQVALAYGLNTAGGLVGVFAATAFLLVAVGVRATGYSAAGVSAVCGLVACLCATSRGSSPVIVSQLEASPPGRPFLWFALAAVSGFGTLGLEVLYTRLFALVFHNSSYTFGAVVGVFLMGLSLGAVLVSALGSWATQRGSIAAATTLGAAAITTSLVLFLRLTGLKYFSTGETFAEYLTHALGLVAAVVLPPATLLGMLLPSVLSGSCGSGRLIGRLSALNTLAAVAGALVAGLLLPRWLGLWESFGVFALLFGLTGTLILRWTPLSRPKTAGSYLLRGAILLLPGVHLGGRPVVE